MYKMGNLWSAQKQDMIHDGNAPYQNCMHVSYNSLVWNQDIPDVNSELFPEMDGTRSQLDEMLVLHV